MILIFDHNVIVEKANSSSISIINTLELLLNLHRPMMILIINILTYIALQETAVNISRKLPPDPFHLQDLKFLGFRLHLFLLFDIQGVN